MSNVKALQALALASVLSGGMPIGLPGPSREMRRVLLRSFRPTYSWEQGRQVKRWRSIKTGRVYDTERAAMEAAYEREDPL
jgi:hypothetical protein